MEFLQQKEIRELTCWIKNAFSKAWKIYKLNNLISDFSNGVVLLQLTETLTCRSVPVLHKVPTMHHERVGNIEMALEILKDDGMSCPGILANDIAAGDCDVIITFCYLLKQHYSRDKPLQSMSSTLGEHSVESTDGFLFQNEAVSHSTEQARESRNDIDGEFDQSPILKRERFANLVVKELDFTPFDKEDMLMFDWASSQIGREILDYHEFNDGTILCQLVNVVSLRRIPPKVIANASSCERIKLAFNFGFHELGIETKLNPEDVRSGEHRKALRKYVNLLREIHLKQIDVLRDKVIHLQNHPCKSICSYEDAIRLDMFSDWSLISQSNSELSGGMKRTQRGLASFRSNPKGNEKQLHSSRTPERVQESLDDSRKSFIGDERLAEVERSFMKRKGFEGLPSSLSASDKEVHEHKTKRQILQKQINHMHKSIEELKSRMKNSRVGENDAERKKHHSTISESKGSKNDSDIKDKDNSTATIKTLRTEQYFKDSYSKGTKLSSDDESAQKFEKKDKSMTIEGNMVSKQNTPDGRTTSKYAKDSQRTTNQRDVARKADMDDDKITSNDKDDNHYDTSDVRCASACSMTSTSSSLSQVAHDVTRLVRLSSRRPKGCVE